MSLVVVEPDLSSIAFGNIATDKKSAVLITLQVVSFGFAGNVNIQVTPSVLSPDGGTITVFSEDWTASPPVFSQQIPITVGASKSVALPIVLTAAGTEPGDTINGNITISGALFPTTIVPFSATVVGSEVQSVAVDLILDCSASMNSPLAGSTRSLVMRRACERAAALLGEHDWLGVIRTLANFSEIFKPEHFTGTRKTDILTRFSATNNTYKPISTDPPTVLNGALTRAKQSLSLLCSCSPIRRGIIVMTDGLCTPPTPPTDTSFAIGIGLPGEIDPVTLAACSSTGTFFVLDSMPNDGTEDAFLLDKYLIQAIAEIADLPVVFDPHGAIRKDDEVHVPFHLTELDSEARVMVLVDDSKDVEVDLHAADEKPAEPEPERGEPRPRGRERLDARPPRKGASCRHEAIDFANVRGASRVKTNGHVTMKVNRGRRADASLRTSGEWQLKLRLSQRAKEEGRDLASLRYSVVVLARSELKFYAQVNQDQYGIGGMIFLTARVLENGGPVTSQRAQVFAQIRFPDGSNGMLTLTESIAPGRFTGELRGTQPGVYRIRFRAQGVTSEEQRFHRELTYTAYVARCATPCGPRQPSADPLAAGVDAVPSAVESESDEIDGADEP